MVSIVIPAYNEGQTIERCLRSILAQARPNEFEIVVVCNGCKDDTAERARAFASAGVTVVETPIGSKIHALNLGDRHVHSFPRFYVDADIDLGTAAIRDVAAMLGPDSDLVVAAPQAVVDSSAGTPWVKAFYHVWTRLPYFTEGIIGAGVYAFSARGRARFDQFPDILSDDEFARLQARPSERRASRRSTFTITPPTRIAGVAKIFTRAKAGNFELHERFPDLVANDNTNASRTLRVIAVSPNLWLCAPIYLGVMAYASWAGKRKLRGAKAKVWERDESARAVFKSRGIV